VGSRVIPLIGATAKMAILEIAAIVVPFSTAVAVAVIGKIQFSKEREHIGPVPDGTSLYALLSQQGSEIAELRREVNYCKLEVLECKQREKVLLKQLGLDSDV
jgi:hypothetical protein